MAASIRCYGVSNLATTWRPSTSPWRPHSGRPISNPDQTMVTTCRSNNQHPTRPMATTLVSHLNSTRPDPWRLPLHHHDDNPPAPPSMAATSSTWLCHHGSAPTSMAAPPHRHRPVLPSDFRPVCLFDSLCWPSKVTPSGQHHRREKFPPPAHQPRTMEGKHGVVAAGKQQDVLLVFFFPC